MANYIKSFNFRNGVQVDNDNFIVNAAGRVGIGTTVPDKILDVRGNAKVVGHITATDASVSGIVTVGSITIDGSTGTISATTFSGSAGNFGDQAVVAITTDGFVVSATGLTTTSSIGIGTTNPQAKLDVRGTLGISNTTDTSVRTTITSIANNGLFVNHNDNSDFILQNQGTERFRITDVGDVGIGTNDPGTKLDVRGSLNVTGISTFGDNITVNGNIVANGNINGDTGTNISGMNNVTANKFTGTDLTGQQLSVSGVSTFSNDILIGTGATVGLGSTAYFKDNAKAVFGDGDDLQIYHDGANSYVSDQGTGDLRLSGNVIKFNNQANTVTMVKATQGDSVELNYDNSKKFETTTTGVSVSGIGSFDSIGIQTSAPSTDLQIRKASGNATLEVISDTSKASISIGNSVGAGTSSASIFFGSDAGFGVFSTDQSFNIINRDTGNFNYFVSSDISSDSGFRWHKGSSNTLMTLTGIGSLGIGITNPQHKLSVQGISTFTGNAHFDNNVTIDGTLTADLTGNVTGNVTGNLSGNVNTTTGISTFNDIKVSEVGIGTTSPRCVLDLGESAGDDTGFVLFPSTSTSQRNGIGSTIEGAIIYNNTNKRLELYNGIGWVGIATVV